MSNSEAIIRTAEQPNSRTAEQPNSRTAEQPNSRTAEQPNSRTAEQPNSRTSNLPLVSIIIPAYNTAQYIHRAIESSLRQTYKNIEVIIIDDGSNDDTLKIAHGYADKDERIRVFTQPNAGVSAARNYGIREAKGEYMIFLDSDDWLEDDAVEVLLVAQLKYPDKLISANCYNLREDSFEKIENENCPATTFVNIRDVVQSYTYSLLFHALWAKIFDAEVISCNSIDFPEGISHSEDAVFVIKYLYRTNGAVFLSRPLYNLLFRKGSATKSSYKHEMLQSQIDAYDILINLPENTPEIKTLMSISRTCRVMSYIDASFSNVIDGVGNSEIQQIRYYLQPYAGEFLHCNKLPLKRKVKFLVYMYMPAWMGRVATSIWKLLKTILRKK